MKLVIQGIEIELERLPNGKFKKPLLSEKYKGFRYSISPLKQTNETIMVFQKPYKTGSCLHDTLAYENGDKTCCCGALDIDGGRCGTEKVAGGGMLGKNGVYGKLERDNETMTENIGRYPAQAFVSPEVGEVLGETIKILHKCPYEEGEMDLYYYCPKVSKQERNGGLDDKPDRIFESDVPVPERAERPFNPTKNPHPTMKPISLNERILKLFKTPNPQKILYPFAGSGSEVIGGIRAGFTDWEWCELNPEYIEIAEARIKHWSQKPTVKQEVLF